MIQSHLFPELDIQRSTFAPIATSYFDYSLKLSINKCCVQKIGCDQLNKNINQEKSDNHDTNDF